MAGSYGRVLKGGIPDKVAAARQVLKDWNSGRIPYYTVPPEHLAPQKANDATILSSFSKEFDLTQFDDAVMKNLKDSDEMDFVQLEEADEKEDDQRTWHEASDFMMRHDGVSDDSEGDEDMEDASDGET